jgi:hypothetical protein
MSAGGVFKLIANDGKADRMIMATELLNQRVKDIMCTRAKQGHPDPTPTLVDIERTHILFVNAHFKPFAAIGYEYNRVGAQQGTPGYGAQVGHSIPQFGDFFHDMVVHFKLSKTRAAASPAGVPALPSVDDHNAKVTPGYEGSVTDNDAAVFGGAIPLDDNNKPKLARYVAPTPGGAADKVIVNEYRYVDLAGYQYEKGATEWQNLPTSASADDRAIRNFVRYAEYPGQRLLKKVSFHVNGNPLDEYDQVAMMMYEKFRVTKDKRTGWKRLVGQEHPVECYSDLAKLNGGTTLSLDHVNTCGSLDTITARKVGSVVNGPQTPKLEQPELDLWIPLLFWFARDPRLSIPSVSIPYGQRFIYMDIAAHNEILFTAPGNLFLECKTLTYKSSDGTAGGIDIADDVGCVVTKTPVLLPDSGIQSQEFVKSELYINNIFVNPEIHDIYIKRIGFTLIRVHRMQQQPVQDNSASVQLTNFKWPVETIYVGARPQKNIAASNPNQWRDWHRLTNLTDHVISESCNESSLDLATAKYDPDETGLQNLADSARMLNCRVECGRCTFAESQKTIDSLTVTAHGISIFAESPGSFFTAYKPWQYGGHNIVTPEDDGAHMINFCLYPGTYQPSGHVNISRAREFFVEHTSSYASSSSPVDMLYLGVAINFLLISDGSAVLRYST